MTPERWQYIDRLLGKALELAASERAAFLDQACAGDEALRRKVEALLAAHERAEGFIETPALEAAVEALADQARSMVGGQLGPYQVLALLGRGGMGEVYRARDTRLGREVAIKVLPAHLTQDAVALARFEREAQAVAALSHPNILAIHDFGNEQGVVYAVTELLDGETLRRRLTGSPLPWRETVEIALAVTEGLAAAHTKGIIHRDLKPENIFLTSDGRVKILDFGLARRKPGASIPAISSAPTVPIITEPGMVMGTVGYMSPEQVRGEDADAPSDLFSFGCVLYEMVAGERAFARRTAAETMAAILHDEPPKLANTGKGGPPELGRVISCCLKKKPEERYQSARELASDLKTMLSGQEISTPPSARATGRLRPIAWIAAALALLVVVALMYWLTHRSRSPSMPKAPVAPLKIIPLTSYQGIELFPSFSPDGTQMTFMWHGERQNNHDIYTRTVEHGTPLRLTTDPAEDSSPAWSPDGRLIAFLRYLPNGKAGLFLTTPLSRAERLLTEVAAPRKRVGFWGPHLAWSPNSKWIATADKSSPETPIGLFLISIETGEKRPIALPAPFAGGVISPAFSPDGRSLAFIRIFGFFVSELYLLALTEDLNPRGEPIQLTYFKNQRTASPVWSQDGREIIFASGGAVNSRLYRIAAAEPGKPQQIESVDDIHNVLSLSHAAHRLAYVRAVWDSNIWRLQLGADEKIVGAPSSLISSTRLENNPQFSPDGKRVAFISDQSGDLEVWVCDSDGSNARRLTSFGGPQTDCVRWSPDGERLVFQTYPEGHLDIYLVNVRGGPPERLTHEPSDDNLPSWSRDGRWIYFTSTRSGFQQVWKMRTDGSGAVQVTRNGGYAPLESTDGKVLYYAKGTPRGVAVWRVPVDGGEEVEVLAGISDWSNYLPTDKGIYFTPMTDSAAATSIQFLNFADGKVKTIAALAKPVFLGLTISPDGRFLLYTQWDQQGFDLMLVENFR